MLQHGFLVAQTAIADQTADGATRLTALGYLTTAYTVGASVGPAVGGFLGANGNYFIGAKVPFPSPSAHILHPSTLITVSPSTLLCFI